QIVYTARRYEKATFAGFGTFGRELLEDEGLRIGRELVCSCGRAGGIRSGEPASLWGSAQGEWQICRGKTATGSLCYADRRQRPCGYPAGRVRFGTGMDGLANAAPVAQRIGGEHGGC